MENFSPKTGHLCGESDVFFDLRLRTDNINQDGQEDIVKCPVTHCLSAMSTGKPLI